MPLEQTCLNFKPKSTHRRPRQSTFAYNRRLQLRAVAAETTQVLPGILAQLPNFDATASSLHSLNDTASLDANDCPRFTLPADDVNAGQKGTRIRILNQDTFDAALSLQPNTTVNSLSQTPLSPPSSQTQDVPPTSSPPRKPVAVLNLASETHPGGGWQNGALAQEECLCYRSSLALSLSPTHYPLPTLSVLYSPNVLLIRSSMSTGHTLLPTTPDPASTLPVTSVISVAGLRNPDIKDGRFAMDAQRNVTKRKIRVSLRVAARQGHTKVVLGALGCGVFANPPGDVAACFLEVLREAEFQGGWWEDVVFAVLDNARGSEGGVDGVGNFGVFYCALHEEIV